MRIAKHLLLLVLTSFLCLTGDAQKFKITYTDSAFGGPFTGKVYLYLSKDTKSPRTANAGLPRLACFAIEAKNITPGKPVIFDEKAIGYPVKLEDLERGTYYVEAVWDRNLGGRVIGTSPGNMYSIVKEVTLTAKRKQVYNITCDILEPQPVFLPTQFAKELAVPSERLTKFYHRATTVNAAVVLPAAYFSDTTKRFPVLFEVSGFGGDYRTFYGDLTAPDGSSVLMDSVPVIYVLLDGACPFGHSEYANSANNGDWGDALVKDFIPELDRQYRTDGARLLWGHSSGGWSVAWLQMHYPDVFTAAWSSSPDPVDFRDFSGVNIYKAKNYFTDSNGALTTGASVAGSIPWVYAREYNGVETALSRGEQMRSFDAVFSPLGNDGQPLPGWNYVTGEIDSSVINGWRNYDISLLIREHPEVYREAVANRLRISVGRQDNFDLQRAVRLLEKETKNLGVAIEYQYYPGDHFTIWNADYFNTGMAFLNKCYKKRMTK